MRSRRILVLAILTLASCEQARRYPATESAPTIPDAPRKSELPAHWAWMRPLFTPQGMPIEFVASTSSDWAGLPKFWNPRIHPAAGVRTIHLSMPPLEAAVAVAAAEQMDALRIKVPLGLPDPTPYIPSANPPTFEKWRLGKRLFFAKFLRSGTEKYACASCHQPDHGFTEARPKPINGLFNTPSLINAVYNRHQFWDGRAGSLEEVVVRSLEDEQPPPDDPDRAPEVTHVWGGLVKELSANEEYRLAFQAVFGISQATQDAIGKALATYMRTILSGDSTYDRADAEHRRAKADAISAEHFRAVLAEPNAAKRPAIAEQLVRGQSLFNQHCSRCHRGPLFTDDDFHALGVTPLDGFMAKRMGRVAVVPIGLKEERLIGAYKTPTLRALPRTARYFHDGHRLTLHEVVRFYDTERDPQHPLGLKDIDIDALVLFLEALDGTPVDPVVTAPPESPKR